MSAEVDGLRQQLTEVQTQLAFQEDTLQTLNDALGLQQQEILLLRRQLELLKLRQDEGAAQSETDQRGGPVDERPPHY